MLCTYIRKGAQYTILCEQKVTQFRDLISDTYCPRVIPPHEYKLSIDILIK